MSQFQTSPEFENIAREGCFNDLLVYGEIRELQELETRLARAVRQQSCRTPVADFLNSRLTSVRATLRQAH